MLRGNPHAKARPILSKLADVRVASRLLLAELVASHCGLSRKD